MFRMPDAPDTLLTLRHGAHSAVLAPGLGAWLLRYEVDDRAVLRCPADWRGSFPQKTRAGNPLLFPIASNLSLDGRPTLYRDGDAEYRLPLHGFARDLPWNVKALSETAVTCGLESSALTRVMYPWDFAAELTVRLDDAGLHTVFSVVNRSDRPLPVHFGYHPYLQLAGPPSEYVIRVPNAASVYLAAPPPRPAPHPESREIPLDDTLGQTRFYEDVEEGRLDLIHRPTGDTITVEADAATFPCWAIWRESADCDYVCLEPWSASVNALNTGERLRWIAPGERFEAAMRLHSAFP
jgi:galactose mutarotase-like enzyme